MLVDIKNLPPVSDNETVLDLGRKGYRIIQTQGVYRFGMDSVLLAHFAKVKPGWRVLDLCCGGGVIPLLMHARNPEAAYYGIELNDVAVDSARRSVLMNGLENAISIIKGDVRHVEGLFDMESFDAITVNPPYFPIETGKASTRSFDNIARHENSCTLEDVMYTASRLLRFGGRFYTVHRPDRLTGVMSVARKHNLEPKTFRAVHSFDNRPASLALMSMIKGAGEGLIVEAPLVTFKGPDMLSDELIDIYNSNTK